MALQPLPDNRSGNQNTKESLFLNKCKLLMTKNCKAYIYSFFQSFSFSIFPLRSHDTDMEILCKDPYIYSYRLFVCLFILVMCIQQLMLVCQISHSCTHNFQKRLFKNLSVCVQEKKKNSVCISNKDKSFQHKLIGLRQLNPLMQHRRTPYKTTQRGKGGG